MQLRGEEHCNRHFKSGLTFPKYWINDHRMTDMLSWKKAPRRITESSSWPCTGSWNSPFVVVFLSPHHLLNMEPNIKTNVWKSDLLTTERLFDISLLVTRSENMYHLIYFYKLAPWGITKKKIQNECTARSKSFPNFKMLDSFVLPEK